MEFQNIGRTVLRLIFAAGGVILLFHGSFSKMQFEDRASLKGMCFIILSLGVGFFVFRPLKCNDMFEKLCDMHFLVNAVVKLLLLGLFSMVIFFTKYPGLKNIHHSEGKRSRKVYDLLGVGSFSAFALVMSWERQHGGAGFGVFEFMLGLTVDASMEIPAGHDDGSGPNLWYMVGAYVYCFLLLIFRSYRNSSSTDLERQLQEQDDQLPLIVPPSPMSPPLRQPQPQPPMSQPLSTELRRRKNRVKKLAELRERKNIVEKITVALKVQKAAQDFIRGAVAAEEKEHI